MNLLLVSGDASPAQGRRGPFAAMLEEFARYWERVDVITPSATGARASRLEGAPTTGEVYFWPNERERHTQVGHILSTGRRLAQERSYALIASHDYGLFLNGLGASSLGRRLSLPHVSEIHHVEGHPRAATLGETARRVVAVGYLRWMRDRATAFRVVNSLELPELLARHDVPAAKIRVLYSLYLDFGVFHPAPRPKEYDIVFVGRLAPNKGLFLVLDALAKVKRRHGSLRAAIAGEGPLKNALRRRTEALGLSDAIQWLGWQVTPNDVAELYRRSRCLVCASYSEGGPRVVAEALACGTPVVSTPVGMARELVRDGENGFLFRWSADELAERLEDVLSDEEAQRRLGAGGPAAVRRFEKRQVVREYAMAYRDLVTRGQGDRVTKGD